MGAGGCAAAGTASCAMAKAMASRLNIWSLDARAGAEVLRSNPDSSTMFRNWLLSEASLGGSIHGRGPIS